MNISIRYIYEYIWNIRLKKRSIIIIDNKNRIKENEKSNLPGFFFI